MKVEQTKWFREDVNFMIQLAKNHMYCSEKDILQQHIKRLARMRGKTDAVKIAKTANRALHKKVYAWEAL